MTNDMVPLFRKRTPCMRLAEPRSRWSTLTDSVTALLTLDT